MDGRPHRMATLDDDRGEKSMFYIAHSDGRPAGYAKNNRTGEEQRWKASAVTMSKEQFTAIAAPGKLAEREADRVATWEKTAERLRAQLETYPALSADHDYLQAKRIALEPGVYQTAKGSLAIPAYDADGKLWSVQYVNLTSRIRGPGRFFLRRKSLIFKEGDYPKMPKTGRSEDQPYSQRKFSSE